MKWEETNKTKLDAANKCGELEQKPNRFYLQKHRINSVWNGKNTKMDLNDLMD